MSSPRDRCEAVAPADRVIEAPIYRRAAADRRGYEILDADPSWLERSDFKPVTVDSDG